NAGSSNASSRRQQILPPIQAPLGSLANRIFNPPPAEKLEAAENAAVENAAAENAAAPLAAAEAAPAEPAPVPEPAPAPRVEPPKVAPDARAVRLLAPERIRQGANARHGLPRTSRGTPQAHRLFHDRHRGRLLYLLGICREHLRHNAAPHHGRAATQWPLGQARLRQSGRAFQSLSESRNDGRLV